MECFIQTGKIDAAIVTVHYISLNTINLSCVSKGGNKRSVCTHRVFLEHTGIA